MKTRVAISMISLDRVEGLNFNVLFFFDALSFELLKEFMLDNEMADVQISSEHLRLPYIVVYCSIFRIPALKTYKSLQA